VESTPPSPNSVKPADSDRDRELGEGRYRDPARRDVSDGERPRRRVDPHKVEQDASQRPAAATGVAVASGPWRAGMASGV